MREDSRPRERGKRILVTGGAGFIGANLVRLLLAEGYQVRVLDNFSTGLREHLSGLELEVREGDIRDPGVVAEAVAGVDSVVHLAAQAGVQPSLANPGLNYEVNVLGTFNLLEACRRVNGSVQRKVHRFVFASSNSALGRQLPPGEETKAPLPISPYGASKLAGEGYCLAYYASWGLGTLALRFANIYGPYSLHKNTVVAKFLEGIIREGRITINGDGRQTRDFLHVEDLCRAILLALEKEVAGEVFQVASGQETSVLELAALVRAVVGREVTVCHGPPLPGDVQQSYSAIAKAKQMLGWEPQIDLRQGLFQVYRWFAEALGR